MAFADDCPRAGLSLVTGPTDRLVNGPVRWPDLVETPVCEERLVLGAVMRDPRILVFRAGCSYRRRLESVLRVRGAIGVRRMEFGTLDGILGCVGAGMGLTLLPGTGAGARAAGRGGAPPDRRRRP
ncbi:LysR substrate-binding domain-containing protein [Streptomyces acidiscabies]|uniref:LysR substrate-binding domain-containing protein n=1 Tax=Streptomyces acidiscabies TaxID=42234 RepID=UPI0038F5F725